MLVLWSCISRCFVYFCVLVDCSGSSQGVNTIDGHHAPVNRIIQTCSINIQGVCPNNSARSMVNPTELP